MLNLSLKKFVSENQFIVVLLCNMILLLIKPLIMSKVGCMASSVTPLNILYVKKFVLNSVSIVHIADVCVYTVYIHSKQRVLFLSTINVGKITLATTNLTILSTMNI